MAENSSASVSPNLGSESIPTSDLLRQSVADCGRLAIAVFMTALYVAVALATKTELITADERLVNALGSRFPVRWLGVF